MSRPFTLLAWLVLYTRLVFPTQAQVRLLAAPTLLSRSPIANRPAAPRPGNVDLRFSEAMTATTAGSTAVKLHGAQTGSRSGATVYAGGGTSLITANPSQDFRPGELVTVSVTTQARSLASNTPLAAPYVYQFRAAGAVAPGTFAVAPAVPTGTGSPRGQAAGDFDHDGDVDFAVAYFNSNSAQLFLNGGSGTFTAGGTFATGPRPVAMATADIDGDGDLDLLTVNRTGNSVTVAKNGGSPTYTFAVSATLALGAGSLAQTLDLGDVDGDGDLDLVVSRFSANAVSVFLNNGSGAFTAGTPVTMTRPYAVRLADLDNDGDLDMAVTQRSATPPAGDRVFLRLNSGSGTFSALPDLLVGAEPYDVQAADVDRDGDNDLLVANTDNNTVSIRRNNGAAAFSGSQNVPVGKFPSNVALADVDGDGDLDFATANLLTISVRFNNSHGVYSGTMEVPTYDDPFTILAADVDGDHDVDFLVNNTTTNSESILLNKVLQDTTISVTETLIGSYRNVTVTGTGHVTLGAAVAVTGTFWVQNGGELNPLRFPVVSSGQFVLDAGGTLHTADALGLTLTGLDGPVQVAAGRAYSDDAAYVYDALGTTAQVTGPGLPPRVRNLTVSQAGSLTLTRALGVRRLLRLTGAGHLKLGAFDLTLRSDTTYSAMVTRSGAGTVQYTGTGRAVVQRAVNPVGAYTGAAYRHYSLPVQSGSVADFDASNFRTRPNAAYNPLPTPTAWVPGTFPNIFSYDQSRIVPAFSAFDTAWSSPAARTSALAVGRGYALHVGAGALIAPRGQLNDGAISTGALARGGQAASGWHMLGNPYPAPLDWNVVRTTPGAIPAGLDDAVSVFQPTGYGAYDGTYLTYVNGLGTLPGGLIPVMQGFFVHCSAPVAAPGFTFQNAFRSTSYQTPTFWRAAPDTRPVVDVQLTGPAGADHLFVYWQEGATAGFDPHFDARKLTNPAQAPSLATRTPAGDLLAISGLSPAPGNASQLPLSVRAGLAGSYTLSATPQHLPAGWGIWLDDQAIGRTVDLRQTGGYTFTVQQAGWLAAGRLRLRVGPAGLPVPNTLALLETWPTPVPRGEALHVAFATAGPVQVTLRDAMGQAVRVEEHHTETDVRLSTTGLRPGVYLLTAETADGTRCTRRVVVQ